MHLNPMLRHGLQKSSISSENEYKVMPSILPKRMKPPGFLGDDIFDHYVDFSRTHILTIRDTKLKT